MFTKFCMLMHNGPPNPKKCSKKSIFNKFKMVDGDHLEHQKILISLNLFG